MKFILADRSHFESGQSFLRVCYPFNLKFVTDYIKIVYPSDTNVREMEAQDYQTFLNLSQLAKNELPNMKAFAKNYIKGFYSKYDKEFL